MNLWDLRDKTDFKDLRLSLGRRPESGQPYLLFMVQYGITEYEARLPVSEEAFQQYQQDPLLAERLTARFQGLTHEQVRAAGAEC